MKKKLLSLCLAAALMLAMLPLLAPAAGAVTPKFDDVYQDFLTSGGYEPYLEDSELVGEPDLYSIADLNGDGVPELLIDSNDGWAFNTTFVFTLDKTDGSVEFLTSVYSCGGISYSKEYNCIAYTYPKPTAMEGSLGFYSMTDEGFTLSFSLYFENYSGEHYYLYHYDEAGKRTSKTELTSEEFDTYVKAQDPLKWDPLPEISAPAQTQQPVQTDITRLYLPALEAAIEDSEVFGWDGGVTALVDLNQDGTQELVMVYTAKVRLEDGYDVPGRVCSICTIDGGRVVTLLDKEMLYVEAGGSNGSFSVVEKDGQRYAALYSICGETGMSSQGIHSDGSWTLHTLADNYLYTYLTVSFTLVEYADVPVAYDESSAVINGKLCGYEEYEALRDSFANVLTMPFSADEEYLSLAELEAVLRASNAPSPIPESEPTEPLATEPPATEPAQTEPAPTETPAAEDPTQPAHTEHPAPEQKLPLIPIAIGLIVLLAVIGLLNLRRKR